MALITCTDCKKQYSDKASTCPNCGAPTPNIKCEECGQPISLYVASCPNCGAPTSKCVTTTTTSSTLQQTLTILADEKAQKWLKQVSINGTDYINKLSTSITISITSPCQVFVKWGGFSEYKINIPSEQSSILEFNSGFGLQVTLYDKQHKIIFKDGLNFGIFILIILIPLIGLILGMTRRNKPQFPISSKDYVVYSIILMAINLFFIIISGAM